MKTVKLDLKTVPIVIKALGAQGKKHLPTILTMLGIGGFIATAFMAANDGPKYQSAVKKAERDKAEELGTDEESVELTKIEKAKLAIVYFAKEIVLSTASAFSIGYSRYSDFKNLVGVVGMYKAAENQYKDLKKQIVQTDGKEKLREYEKNIHEPVVQCISDYGPTYIYNTGKGTTIFFDPTAGFPFSSDLWVVEKALRHVLQGCRDEGSYPLSAFRHELGLPRNDSEEDYRFYYEFIRDVDEDDLSEFFEYHSLNADGGDNRACIWLRITDYISSRNGSDDEGVPFRYR